MASLILGYVVRQKKSGRMEKTKRKAGMCLALNIWSRKIFKAISSYVLVNFHLGVSRSVYHSRNINYNWITVRKRLHLTMACRNHIHSNNLLVLIALCVSRHLNTSVGIVRNCMNMLTDLKIYYLFQLLTHYDDKAISLIQIASLCKGHRHEYIHVLNFFH